MKLLISILALYFMALSLAPCTDGAAHTEAITSIEVSHSHEDHNHSEHNHEDHEDSCTPFCNCACCGSFVVIPNFSLLQSSSPVTNTYKFHYSFDYSFDYNAGVWHPPAIS